jgi:hypothetical protein
MRVLGLSSVAVRPGAVPAGMDACVAYPGSGAWSLARTPLTKVATRIRASTGERITVIWLPAIFYSTSRLSPVRIYHSFDPTRTVCPLALRISRQVAISSAWRPQIWRRNCSNFAPTANAATKICRRILPKRGSALLNARSAVPAQTAFLAASARTAAVSCSPARGVR